MIGVIAILIACRNLIDSLPQQLEQGVIRMPWRSGVIDLGRRSTEDVETLIDLPHDKKTCIAGDLYALKINAEGRIEFRSYSPCLFVTNYAHHTFLPSDEFAP
jgi:hypothetical protein